MAQGEANLRQTKDSDYKTFRRTVLGMLSGTEYDVKAYFPWKTAHDLYMSRLCRREPLPCNADGDEGVCFTGEWEGSDGGIFILCYQYQRVRLYNIA